MLKATIVILAVLLKISAVLLPFLYLKFFRPKGKTENRYVYWSPRILAMLLIAFLSLFSLDSFSEHYPLVILLGIFLIHMLPSMVIALLTVIAWRREHIGGIMFISIGIGSMVLIGLEAEMLGALLLLTVMPMVIGILFLLNRHL